MSSAKLDLDLDPIRKKFLEYPYNGLPEPVAEVVALVAEVQRLRGELGGIDPSKFLAADLIRSWTDYGHKRSATCPACNEGLLAVGVTKLVYSHEVCSCGDPVYDHLIEQLWHRDCFATEHGGESQERGVARLKLPPGREIAP